MKNRNKSIKSALALATAAFISMPVVAATAVTKTSARRRAGDRCVAGFRDFAGPVSISPLASGVQFNLWRPKVSKTESVDVLGVRVDFINVETGEVLQTSKSFKLEAGKGAVVGMRAEDVPVRLVGARMSVRDIPQRSEKGVLLSSKLRKRCTFREQMNGSVSGPRIHGTLVVKGLSDQQLSRDSVSGDKIPILMPTKQ